MTVENALASCCVCDWIEQNDQADVHAQNHHDATGHRVQMVIAAHVGA